MIINVSFPCYLPKQTLQRLALFICSVFKMLLFRPGSSFCRCLVARRAMSSRGPGGENSAPPSTRPAAKEKLVDQDDDRRLLRNILAKIRFTGPMTVAQVQKLDNSP